MMKKLHFTGIGGAGMAPLAELSLAGGFAVSGSDMENSAKCVHLQQLGAEIFIGHKAENLPDDAGLQNFLSVIPNIEDDHEWSLGEWEVLENNFRRTANNSQKIIHYASENCDRILNGHPEAVRLRIR